MTGQQIGYLRVSTTEQNTSRQLDGIELTKTFEDKCSGKNADRPQLKLLIDYAREGDTVHVHSLDRLARNMDDLKSIIKTLSGKGVNVRFEKENLDFNCLGNGLSPMHELMFNMLAAFAQFERSIILERQREGIALAKKAGKYRGGQPKLKDEQITELKNMLEAGVSKSEIARRLNITRQTIYAYI